MDGEREKPVLKEKLARLGALANEFTSETTIMHINEMMAELLRKLSLIEADGEVDE